jgi:hypothetical protein
MEFSFRKGSKSTADRAVWPPLLRLFVDIEEISIHQNLLCAINDFKKSPIKIDESSCAYRKNKTRIVTRWICLHERSEAKSIRVSGQNKLTASLHAHSR